jgi:hypothetical protein
VPSTAVLAADRRQQQSGLARATAAQMRRLWRQVDRDQIMDSWSVLSAPATAIVTAAQYRAAATAQTYVEAAVRDQGATPAPAGQVAASQLAGVASDGRPLTSLLDYPAHQTLAARALGMAPSDAMLLGERSLVRIAVTQVQDAGRVATGIGIVSDRVVNGYIREVGGKACSRCAILAGKWYRYSTGFLRHPNCQCVHIPATREMKERATANAAGLPRAYFDSLSRSLQDQVFGRSGADAIRDGADPAQVVNARRGMSTADAYGRQLRATNEGITRFGAAGQRAQELGFSYSNTPRLMPEQIYAAAESREQAIELLYRFGYIL